MKYYTAEQVGKLDTFNFSYILHHRDGHTLNITLNRAAKKNAMNPQMMNEIVFLLAYAHFTPSVWVVILAAEGDVFCAGADLKSFAGQVGTEETSTVPEPAHQIALGEVFNSLHKPCIAAVHAPVYAGGFLLICGCTHVITVPEATFSLPEVKRGIWPMQVMESLAGIMSPRQLLDFCMRARTIEATEAKTLGLVTEVIPKERLMERVKELANEIQQYSPSAVRLGLKAWQEMQEVPKAERHSFLLGALQNILLTNDAAEGLQAFLEKRQPQWKGE